VTRPALIGAALIGLALALAAGPALAHAIGGSDAAFVAAARGPDPFPFAYLGAKHMVTGYDHLLYLAGVVFFLTRLRDVLLYVSLFSLGHSITLITGVLTGTGADAHLVDAVIGLLAVLAFGLVHGLGLATKLRDLGLNPEGRLANLVAFNVGVELGQILALSMILLVVAGWRRLAVFGPTSIAFNLLLMTAGVVLTGQQIAGYLHNLG
jgi:HupE / UreJ protein